MINDFNNLNAIPGLTPGLTDPASDPMAPGVSDQPPASWYRSLDTGSALPIIADPSAAGIGSVAEKAGQVLAHLSS